MAGRKRQPAATPEERHQRAVAKAFELAEKQLEEGTASSQIINYFLKIGSQREELEMERLRRENEMLRAKTESLQASSRLEELYLNAVEAMGRYRGRTDSDED